MPAKPYSFFAEQPSELGTYKAFWSEDDLAIIYRTPLVTAVIELISDNNMVLETWEVLPGAGRKFSENTMYTQVP